MTGRKRRQETLQATCVIHGGSSSNTIPAPIGMVETVETFKEDLVNFENSNDNMLQSIACYNGNGGNG